MRDYKTNNYYRENRGYTSSPLVVILFVVLAYSVAGMSAEQISQYFGF